MTPAPHKVLLGKASLLEAQTLKSRLARAEIEVALIHNGSTCTSGCQVQVEIWAHPDDTAEIARLMADEHRRVLSDMGYDITLADAVFDPAAATATCPACAATFPTTSTCCPECDLHFDVPDPESGGCGSCG